VRGEVLDRARALVREQPDRDVALQMMQDGGQQLRDMLTSLAGTCARTLPAW
jgi:hypothetical protein